MRKRLFTVLGLIAIQLLFVLFAIPALAQTSPSAGIPAVPGMPYVNMPTSLSGYWDLVIAAIAPFIVTGIAKVVPKLPRNLLPLVTPIVGVVVAHILSLLTNMHLSWFDAAKAGALAVFVREVVNQNVSKYLNVTWGPPTPVQGPPPQAPGAVTAVKPA